MRKRVVLITGAAGEIGQALIQYFAEQGQSKLLTFDLNPLPEDLQGKSTHIIGDVLDKKLFARLVTEYQIDIVFHMAALLSTRCEFAPDLAHQVNVNGTLNLLQLMADQSQRLGAPVKFIFPSSVAAYGMPDLETKTRDKNVREWDWNYPATVYGCNKLYCEILGNYYGKHYLQLAESRPTMLDFRSLRFPGLISAFTVPSGGTTDYGPEMLHAAAEGKPYTCFVREDTVLPFMAMPDAVKSLLLLAETPRENLKRTVYNVTSFSLSAADFRQRVMQAFPNAQITFKPDQRRQRIVDSWPAGMNDKAAHKDLDWQPDYAIDRAFNEYLIPNIIKRYRQT